MIHLNFHIYKKIHAEKFSIRYLGRFLVDFFGTHNIIYSYIQKINMVITTYMIHKMTLKSQQESNNDKVPNNPDSTILESFLKNSDGFQSNPKVISSHS